MFWKKKRAQPQGPPVSVEKPAFSEVRVTSVTFTADRLPYLKNLLVEYQEDQERQRRQHQHDFELQELLTPLSRDLATMIRQEYNAQQGEIELLYILAAHAGELLDKLTALRSAGWDGSGLNDRFGFDQEIARYADDAIRQLQHLITALEAGNAQVTLNIPSQFQSEYETWFISSIEYAVRENKGSASSELKRG